jgi:hypothetical protein
LKRRPYLKDIDHIDPGAGSELKDGTKFEFSISASVVEAFGVAATRTDELFPLDVNQRGRFFNIQRARSTQGVRVLNVLRYQAEELIERVERAEKSVTIWELRVAHESLKELYDLYCRQSYVENLRDLPLRVRNALFVSRFSSPFGNSAIHARTSASQMAIYMATVLQSGVNCWISIFHPQSGLFPYCIAIVMILAAVGSLKAIVGDRKMEDGG